MKTIVAGITPDTTAQKAAERAITLAGSLGSTVHFVYVVDHDDSVVVGIGGERREVHVLDQAKAAVRGVLEEMGVDTVDHTISALEGDPAKALVQHAKEVGADLIVVGNVRMQGLGRVLGSVGSHVVHHAPCDVLVVKTS